MAQSSKLVGVPICYTTITSDSTIPHYGNESVILQEYIRLAAPKER